MLADKKQMSSRAWVPNPQGCTAGGKRQGESEAASIFAATL